jgi:hypothetical protein
LPIDIAKTMSAFTRSPLVEQMFNSTEFDWTKLQQVIAEFSIAAKPALCVLDFFREDGLVRVKQREIMDLQIAFSDEDWQYCFTLADGMRPIGSEVPHWLKELSDGVFSRSTCLVAEPVHDENGLTIGLFYAFYASGTPEETTLAYQRSMAKHFATLVQQWQYGRRHSELISRLWTSIELSCPGYLILDEKLRIVQKGSLYSKSVPHLAIGDKFEQHFIWDGQTSPEEWNTNSNAKRKLRFYHALELNQRYKCSIQSIQSELYLLLANPVINPNHAMVDYHLTASDFAPHDYITDFVFLHTITMQSLEEIQRSNEVMQARNRELEWTQADLLRNKLILENKISERNERVLRLSNFPEQNPNPVFEIDYNRQFICFSNQAAKSAFGELLTLPYHEFLAMLSLSHELIVTSLKLRVEFECANRYFLADATRVPNEEIIRFYAQDATEIKHLKSLLLRQQQGINQLIGVLEAFNIDRSEAARSANLNEVIQEVSKILSSKRG